MTNPVPSLAESPDLDVSMGALIGRGGEPLTLEGAKGTNLRTEQVASLLQGYRDKQKVKKPFTVLHTYRQYRASSSPDIRVIG